MLLLNLKKKTTDKNRSVVRWPIKDMKPQLFILGNWNGKTYYFTFGVLFSDLSSFPLLKPKFFLKFYFKTFFKTQIFSKLTVFF